MKVNQSDDLLDSYNVDWMHQVKGESRLVLRPKSTEQVAQILKYCSEQKLALTIQGGNTGLVQASVPVFDEIIISMQLMNQIQSFDDLSGALVCQAGCILQNLNDYVSQRGFTFPLDLGAKGSCQIGGNLATNAGGVRYARYGSLHANLLGLEVALADGSVLSDLKTVPKDNTGFHLNHLFLGSEGSLGVITKASIKCPPASNSISVALLGLEKFEQVAQAYKLARESLGEILSAFEFFDEHSMKLVEQIYGSNIRNPLDQNYKFFLLIETRGSNSEHDEAKLSDFLERATERGIVDNGTLATSPREIQSIWRIREHITLALGESCKPGEKMYKYDLGIPLPQIYELVDIMKEKLKGTTSEIVGYGHCGDSNLHLNIVGPDSDEFLSLIEPFVYEWVSERNGSISAEHGIGRVKPKLLHLSKSANSIHYMRQLKQLFDPNGVLMPYRVLPPQTKEK